MADFSFLPDTDESAVEEILAEAMDHIVLKQVAAINCASFSHSVLPSNLESRFQRLKTFPSSSNPKPQLVPDSATEFQDSANSPIHDNPNSGDSVEIPGKERNFEGKSRSGYVSSPSDSSNSLFGHADTPKLKPKSGDGEFKERESRSGSFSFRSNTAKIGCFWCSPKRVSRKKSGNSNTVAQRGLDWGKKDHILSELKSFSSKEQKKILKEKEKINKEVEKIVKWAKQASARLDFSDIDDALSDDDSKHNFGLH